MVSRYAEGSGTVGSLEATLNCPLPMSVGNNGPVPNPVPRLTLSFRISEPSWILRSRNTVVKSRVVLNELLAPAPQSVPLSKAKELTESTVVPQGSGAAPSTLGPEFAANVRSKVNELEVTVKAENWEPTGAAAS